MPDLIDQIYDTAVEPDNWPKTLASVSSFFECISVNIIPYKDPAALIMSAGSEGWMGAYHQYWCQHDAMVAVGRQLKDFRGLVCDWSTIGQDHIARDSFYQDFRRGHGMGYCLEMTFEAYPAEYAAIGLNLPSDKPPLEAKALEQIEIVLKHMVRALAISARYSPMQATNVDAGLCEILSKLQCAGAIVNHAGLVLGGNTRFEALARDGLRIVDGRLKCHRPECQKGLDLLIRAATVQPLNPNNKGLALISRPSGRRPFMARAIPMAHDRSAGLWRRSSPEKQALLLVVDLDAEALTASDDALRLLGLTPAEAKVAALIGGGRSPREAAADLGTSEGTVRNQLKHVFSKTGLSRQTDLVRLVQRLSILN